MWHNLVHVVLYNCHESPPYPHTSFNFLMACGGEKLDLTETMGRDFKINQFLWTDYFDQIRPFDHHAETKTGRRLKNELSGRSQSLRYGIALGYQRISVCVV